MVPADVESLPNCHHPFVSTGADPLIYKGAFIMNLMIVSEEIKIMDN